MHPRALLTPCFLHTLRDSGLGSHPVDQLDQFDPFLVSSFRTIGSLITTGAEVECYESCDDSTRRFWELGGQVGK